MLKNSTTRPKVEQRGTWSPVIVIPRKHAIILMLADRVPDNRFNLYMEILHANRDKK
jgi:hypothetical protein